MAEKIEGKWTNWNYCGDRLMKVLEIGKVHILGDDLYFHSYRNGGYGEMDIWKTTRNGGIWTDPINIEPVNSTVNEGFPFINSTGDELWFTRMYLGTPAIFRSKKIAGEWQEPELILSQFAREPTLDDDGNIYFVHHFFESDVMIEADIYVAYRKK